MTNPIPHIIKEHYQKDISEENIFFDAIIPRLFRNERGQKYHVFSKYIKDDKMHLEANYYVGIDWLIKEKHFIQVEPKINQNVVKSFTNAINEENKDLSEEEIEKRDKEAEENVKNDDCNKEVNVIAMLMDVMSNTATAKHTNHLLFIDWETSEIPATQKQDLLTPFLVVRYLKLLQEIVRKGLKKSYYKVEENLINRVKGKILVGKQIKQNIFKNRLTNTVCEYQVFGENSVENRFLHKVFAFCTQYVENNTNYFKDKNDISWLVNYIRPAFEHIGSDVDIQEVKHLKYNPFFKEYKESIKIGLQILKRFSYNITKTTNETVSTPPFWINMPKLFELYVYAKFLKDNPQLSENNFNYQFATYGNALDFLICHNDTKIVVDTKYKLHYNFGQIHEDIRQVAGYARLNKVKDKYPKSGDNEIPCLIVYPTFLDGEEKQTLKIEDLLEYKIPAYHNVYKLGISLPEME